MKFCPSRSITLIELLVAVVLLSVMVLAFSSIEVFSRFHVTTSDRRAQLQNEVYYVLAHMEKQIIRGIGDRNNSPVDLSALAGDPGLGVYIDLAADGIGPGDGQRNTAQDRWIAYRLRSDNRLQYCSQCQNNPCTQCVGLSNWGSAERLGGRITNFIRGFNVANNYIDISLTGCWDPGETIADCNTQDNPQIIITNRIYMPAVSTN